MPSPLTPADAFQQIQSSLAPLPAEDCPLLQAHGRTLRRPIKADRDLPPFNRVTMDGFAVRSAAVAAGRRQFRVSGFQAAGMVARTLSDEDTCIEIATGAVQPQGADAIVPYEDTRREGEHMVLLEGVQVSAGQSLHARGTDFPQGATLVGAGTKLTGREIAVAAACGCATVSVGQRASVAVIATGDELVEVDAPDLAPHQLRKSNDYAIRAALLATGAAARVDRFHLRDHRPEIEERLRAVLAGYDVVVLTGGVSKGKFEYIPAALSALGVQTVFQGVAQRPGKPMWFGLSPRRTPVFALPGNPVSTYTCLHRYVLPALHHLAGTHAPAARRVRLARAVTFKAPLSYLLPVTIASADDGALIATPAPANTSGDFGGLVSTDGFVELPPGPAVFAEGTVAKFWPWS